MARTVRRKTKDEVYLDKERKGSSNSRKNISRNNKKNRLKKIDYNNPALLEDLDDEYDY